MKAADLVALDLHAGIVGPDSGIAQANRIAADGVVGVCGKFQPEYQVMGVMGDSVQVQKGLEGVVADTTAVSFVDGEGGRAIPRATDRNAHQAHLPGGPAPGGVRRLPDRQRLQEVEEYLWTAGRLPPELATSCASWRVTANPMATLQSITPLLALEPPAVSLGRNARRGPARRGTRAGRSA